MAASVVGGQVIPCFYCLLPNKKEDNIPTAVQQDKGERVGAPNRLTTIITDFERLCSRHVILSFQMFSTRDVDFTIMQLSGKTWAITSF